MVCRVITTIAVFLLPLACDDEPSSLGRVCDLGTPTGTGPVAAGFPSLDCDSRMCLKTPSAIATGIPASGAVGVCTESCFTNDDCAALSTQSCASGFACAVPTIDGSACCLRMCVCRDDLDQLPGAAQVAEACSVSSATTCTNVPFHE